MTQRSNDRQKTTELQSKQNTYHKSMYRVCKATMLGSLRHHHRPLKGIRISHAFTTMSPNIRQVTHLTIRLRSSSHAEKELRDCYYKAIIIVVGQHHHLDYKIPLPCLQTSHTLIKPPHQSTIPNDLALQEKWRQLPVLSRLIE